MALMMALVMALIRDITLGSAAVLSMMVLVLVVTHSAPSGASLQLKGSVELVLRSIWDQTNITRKDKEANDESQKAGHTHVAKLKELGL